MMKRLIAVVLSVALLLSLCACRGTDTTKTPSHELNNDKGTRNNPYQVGETIEINGFKAYFSADTKYTDVLFDLELTINQSYSVADGIAIREKRYDTFTAIPAASVTFTLNSSYDNEMYYSDIFRVGVVNDKMQKDVFTTIEDENQKGLDTIYTGVEYTVNILQSFDKETKTRKEAKYYVIYYRDTDGAEKYIYIAAEKYNEEQGQEEIKQPEESTKEPEVSAEEKNYRTALIAEEKGYYTIAKNIFSKILNYEDAQKHYDTLIEVLQEYNGTYYGESTQYKNVNVYLYIKDGSVTAQSDGAEKSLTEYELYLYGEKEDGAPVMAFAPARTSLFTLDSDTNYDDCIEGYALQRLEDGSYFVGATTYSTGYTWNGFYEKQ